MLTVHHLGLSQSERIVWLCEELDIDYGLVRYDRDATTRLAPANYKALHALGTAPVITDGERVLAESGAIIDYIIGTYGGGRLQVRPGASNFADYLYWFHFANGTMMPNLMLGLSAARSAAGASGGMAAMVADRDRRAYALIEQRLGEVPYFAGDELTAADINMVFALTTGRVFLPRDLSPNPGIRRYLALIGKRPAYQRAMAKGDPGFKPLLD